MYKVFLVVFLLSLVLISSPTTGLASPTEKTPESKAEAKTAETKDNFSENVIVDKGVRVEFAIVPTDGVADKPGPILEGEYADVRFRITDAATGGPVSPLEPAVWISRVKKDDNISCKEMISRYTQGMLGYQADIDLNKYFILIMNDDRSISVVDPLLGVSGITQLYTMILLKDPGEDWIQSADGKRLFVTMPKANSIAVVNLEDFKVVKNVKAGDEPFNIELQPDGKYLWVGNDANEEEKSGVTVIDVQSHRVISHINTGAGHHEISFSTDSLFAFVTNYIDGTLSVIDTQKLEKIKDLYVGKHPIAVQYSTLSQAAYVAARDDGTITVVNGTRHEIVEIIRTKPGVIGMRLAPGNRWLFAANIEENRVDIIDASQGKIAHSLEASAQPHQFAFTDTYGYVRHLGTPEVMLIPLAQLGSKDRLGLQTVAIGSKNPGDYPYYAAADSISPTGEWSAVMAANPADSMIYYYMEGMVAPMGSYPTYGRVPRAVGVVDRSVHEIEKGVYGARIRIPKDGTYNVTFLIDAPWVDHCFTFTAEPNPLFKDKKEKFRVHLEFLDKMSHMPTKEPFKVKFSLTNAQTGEPISGLKDVTVLVTRMPGNWQDRQLGKHVGDGIYEVSIVANQPGVYLVLVGIPSLKVDMRDLPYMNFRGID